MRDGRGDRLSHRFLLRAGLPHRRQGRPGARAAHPPGRPSSPFHTGVPRPGRVGALRAHRYLAVPHAQGLHPGPVHVPAARDRETPRRLQHERRRTIGIRVPDHPVPQLLLAELGEPLMSSTLMLPGDELPLTDGARDPRAAGAPDRCGARRRPLRHRADDGRGSGGEPAGRPAARAKGRWRRFPVAQRA